MTAPVTTEQSTTPPGQPTLVALIAALLAKADAILPAVEGVISELAPEVQQAITTAVGAVQAGIKDVAGAFNQVVDIIDPAHGREVERESELAAMFAAKDTAGLLAYYNDQPPHPNKSRGICANYLKLLGVDANTGQPIPSSGGKATS